MLQYNRTLSPWWLLALVALVALTACAPPAPVGGGTVTTASPEAVSDLGYSAITVCMAALTPNETPLYYAQEKGLFASQGLEVDLVLIEGGPTATAALLAGEADLCTLGGPSVVAAAAAGADVRLLAGLANTYVYSLMVSDGVKTPGDLRGGALAVSDFGSSSDTAARVALRALGLEPDKDVTITPVGGQNDRLAALKGGAVQGTLLSPPQTSVAKDLGFKTLIDMTDLAIPYQHMAIAATGSFIDENPQVVKGFVTAVVQAVAAMQSDETGAKAAIAKALELDPVADAGLLEEAYQVNVRRYLNHKPFPTLDGIRTVMAEVAPENPAVLQLRPEDLVDGRFMQELDQQGLLDGLDAAVGPIRVCYSSVSGTQLPVWYAYEKGLFAFYGLDVQLQDVGGGEQAAAALVAGQADICQGTPSAMIAAAVQGADVVTIAGLVNSSPYSLVVRPEILAADDLRGGAIAVNSLSGSAAVAASSILRHLGLRPNEDVAILAVGDQGERLAAMKSGAVQATLVSPPQTLEAKDLGFSILLDTADLGLPHQHTAINTTRRFLSEHQPEAVAFMKAIISALASFEQDEAGVKETLAKYLAMDPQADAASLDEAYTQLVQKYFVKTPYPTLEGIQFELDELASDNPAVKAVKPEDIVDTSIVQELEEIGFVSQQR